MTNIVAATVVQNFDELEIAAAEARYTEAINLSIDQVIESHAADIAPTR